MTQLLSLLPEPVMLARLLGWLAIGLTVWCVAGTSDTRVRQASIGISLLWALNNGLLGAATAAGLCLLSSLRTVTSVWAQTASASGRRAAFTLFVSLTLLVAAVTWSGWLSVSTAASSLLVTYALYYCSGVKMRLLFALSVLLWLHNAYAVQSTEQALSSLISLAAALTGAWRIHRERTALCPAT